MEQIAHTVDPFVSLLGIFVLAVFVGYYVVWNVTPALHTPLMSVTNAISSVIVVGALLAVGAGAIASGSTIAMIFGFLALILASEKKMRELGADGVRIAGVAMKTRPPGSFEVFQPAVSVTDGGKPTILASKKAYELAGIGPEDIDVAQLQDTESGAEIMHMAENGFCQDGEQEQWLAEGSHRTEDKAHGIAEKWLKEYEAPALDPSIDEALQEFIAKKKAILPDSLT